jgi:[histone H3]-trimethyl-L-lysine9/36 demethylase
VIPPKGWKPRKSGYSDLDNKLIEAPILQNVRQTPNRGAYEVRNTEEDSMTVGQLRRFALDKNMVYSFAEEMEEIERNFWKQLTINPPIYGADSCGTLFDEDVQVNSGRLVYLPDLGFGCHLFNLRFSKNFLYISSLTFLILKDAFFIQIYFLAIFFFFL